MGYQERRPTDRDPSRSPGGMPGWHSQPLPRLQACPATAASPLFLQLFPNFVCAQTKGETHKSSRKLYHGYF